MNSIILLNCESGEFFKYDYTDELIQQIEIEIENGVDVENLQVYKAEMLKINQIPVETYKYMISKCK